MSEWQQQTAVQEDTPVRVKWAMLLVNELETLETNYIMGTIKRDEFNAGLEALNERFGIVGLTLASQPWKTNGSSPRF